MVRLPLRRLAALAGLVLGLLVLAHPAAAQPTPASPAWYVEGRPFVKLAVVEDGVYGVTGRALAAAGVPLAAVDAATLQLFAHGAEVPLLRLGPGGDRLAPDDTLVFVGRRNDGTGEAWAYDGDAALASSTARSLFTDTTHYWLGWGVEAGRRYADGAPPAGAGDATASFRVHVEPDDARYYHGGDPSESGSPLYTRGEGFYAALLQHGTAADERTHTFDVPLPTAVRTAVGRLTVRVRLNGQTNARHQAYLDLRLDDGGGPAFVAVDTAAWQGYAYAELTARIAQDRLPAGGVLSVRVRSTNDLGQTVPNAVLVDWADAAFEGALDAAGGRLHLPGADERRVLSVAGLGPGALVLTPGAAARSLGAEDGGRLRVAVPGGAGDHWAAARAALRTPARLEAAAGRALTGGPGADYVIVAPRALRASAERLAAYRASPAGGGHTTAVVELEAIFDAFDGGRPTPLALRRFVHAAAGAPRPARFVVLWGDALAPDPARARPSWEVPSFGVPASDGWFAMQTGGPEDWTEAVAVGRLPVRSDAMGDRFVDKLRAYEAAEPGAWQKRALFLAGGKTAFEQNLLQTPTRAWSALAAGAPAGLDTLHFFKNADAPVDPSFQDSLRAALHDGAAWMSYFGHSAAFTWEIVTEPPSTYDNGPRLPVVLSLGCYTGNFTVGTGAAEDPMALSEQLVVESFDGGIAHWGSSSLGDISNSALLAGEIHDAVFRDTVRVLGTALRTAKAAFANGRPLVFPARNSAVRHLLQYSLIGDPATRVQLPTRPALSVAPEDVRVTPATPTVADGTLAVRVRARNTGLVPADTVTLALVHTPPGGEPARYTRRVPPFRLHADVRFDVPLPPVAGVHRLEATIDADGAVAEADEADNAAAREQTVFATGVLLVAPADGGVVPTAAPTLRVAVATRAPAADAPPATVAFELDTTATFASPARRAHAVTTRDVYPAWQPDGLLAGTTYHWRARLEGGDAPWAGGVFTVEPGAPGGWRQGGARFADNAHDARLAFTGGAWRLGAYALDVTVNAFISGTDLNKGQFTIEGEAYERLGLGFGLVVLDGATGAVKAHGSMPTYDNAYEAPDAALAELEAVASVAAPGDWVLARTRHLGNRSREAALPERVRAVFRALGSTAVDTLTYADAWVLVARRGAEAPLVEEAASEGEVSVRVEVPFQHGAGATTTPPIGPAAAWDAATWTADGGAPGAGVRLEVLAEDGTVLAAAPLAPNGRLPLGHVDAAVHPTVRLRATLIDSTGRTTPQLRRLGVDFAPAPLLGLDAAALSLDADTVVAGTPLGVEVPVRNLTGTAAPLAVVTYDLVPPGGARRRLHADTLRGVADAATSRLTVDTDGLAGPHTLEVALTGAARVNGLLVVPFHVAGDRTPPTFAVRIEGEALPADPNPVTNLQDPTIPFVPARPYVEVEVEDDHPFARLADDTTAVTVRLDGRRLPYARLGAVPGDGANTLALGFEAPLGTSDSTHTLVVEVRDAAGNAAPGSPYQVHLRTQSTLEVEQVYPYPNPMSTHTVFAFRLRGADVGGFGDLRLRIYTLAGRLVRELDFVRDPGTLDLGGLRIGWNRALWDGRDEDGDPVATGVYLYRLFGTADGQPLGDALGVEKVVVIR